MDAPIRELVGLPSQARSRNGYSEQLPALGDIEKNDRRRSKHLVEMTINFEPLQNREFRLFPHIDSSSLLDLNFTLGVNIPCNIILL